MDKVRILIVEDEAIIAMGLEGKLQSLGYEVTSIVNTGDKAIEKAETDKPDLILMDIRIKGEMDGIDTAEVIRNKFGIPVIFSTAYLDQERIERAKITMPFGYVLKPIQERDLKVTLEMALYVAKSDIDRRRMEKLLRIQRDLGVSLGKSINFDEMLNLCLRAAFNSSKMDSGGIYVVDPVTGSLDFKCHEGLSEEFIATVSQYKADSPNAQLVMQGNSLYTAHNKLEVPLEDKENSEGLRAVAVIPFKSENKVVGCLHLASRTIDEVPVYTRNTLEAIASQIADAIVKKHLEKKQKRQKDIFELVINSVPMRIFWKDLNSVYSGCNPPFAKAAGKNKVEDIISKNDFEMVWGKNAQRFIDDDRQVMRAGIPKLGYDEDYTDSNGKKVWWHTSKMPLKDSAGNINGILATSEDITEKKKAEIELQDSEEQLKALLDNSLDSIRLVDENLRLIWTNRVIEEQVGVNREKTIGNFCYKVYTGRDQPCPNCPTLKALKSGKTEHSIISEEDVKNISGKSHWADYAVPLKDEFGKVVRLLQVSRDITELKQHEE